MKSLSYFHPANRSNLATWNRKSQWSKIGQSINSAISAEKGCSTLPGPSTERTCIDWAPQPDPPPVNSGTLQGPESDEDPVEEGSVDISTRLSIRFWTRCSMSWMVLMVANTGQRCQQILRRKMCFVTCGHDDVSELNRVFLLLFLTIREHAVFSVLHAEVSTNSLANAWNVLLLSRSRCCPFKASATIGLFLSFCWLRVGIDTRVIGSSSAPWAIHQRTVVTIRWLRKIAHTVSLYLSLRRDKSLPACCTTVHLTAYDYWYFTECEVNL